MAKNVLFLMHGVGNHKPGWSKDAQKTLSTEFDRYMKHTGKTAKLKDELRFVEVTYNDIFEAVWKGWAALASSLDAVPGLPDPVAKITNFLGQAGASGSQAANNKAVQYAGDVLLYVSFRLVRKLVLLKVMSTIATTVEKAWQDDIRTEFGVLSHSMGTAVAHDALHLLASTDWSGGKWGQSARQDLADAETAFKNKSGNMNSGETGVINRIRSNIGPAAFSPGRFQFAGLFTFANVSRIVSRTKNPYKSLVRPQVAGSGGIVKGNCDFFCNVAHDLDPIAKVREFDTDKFSDTGNKAIDINVRHLYEKNVHGLSHYLLNPKAHRFIFRRMCASFGGRESEYVDRRFSEELKVEGHADFFARRGGNFSDENIEKEMKDKISRRLTDILEGLL